MGGHGSGRKSAHGASDPTNISPEVKSDALDEHVFGKSGVIEIPTSPWIHSGPHPSNGLEKKDGEQVLDQASPVLPKPRLGFDREAFIEALKAMLRKPLLRRFGDLMVAPMPQTQHCDPKLREWGVRGVGNNRLMLLIRADSFWIYDPVFRKAMEDDLGVKPFMRYLR